MSKYVIIPDLDDIQRKLAKDPNLAKELRERKEIRFMKNSSEWLAVDQHMVALYRGGNTCNKMGVSFTDFKWQPDFCSNKQYRYIYHSPRPEQRFLKVYILCFLCAVVCICRHTISIGMTRCLGV